MGKGKEEEMTPEQRAAYVISQTACALIRMEGMKAANYERQYRGEFPAYNEKAFEDLINEEAIHSNAVIKLFVE